MKVRKQKRMNRLNYDRLLHYEHKKIRFRKKTEILHVHFERRVFVIACDAQSYPYCFEVFDFSDNKKELLYIKRTENFDYDEAYLPIKDISKWYYDTQNPYEYEI